MSKESRVRTTDAFKGLSENHIGIGLRPGNGGHNRVKGNRSQKSKQKMRTAMGMKNIH